jgi:ubiquinol-cytochrome c reductase cytochrome b subunit
VGLHIIRVFIWGAYKKPREMVWLAGVCLLFLTAVFMLTGPILPWDKHGYWAAKVGLSIAASTPVLGPLIQAFLQGSAQVGQVTLSRIYLIHVALLPAVMASMVMIHLIAFRQFGSTGPWDPDKRKIKGQFWPDQIFKDTLVAFFILLLLIGFSAFVPAPFSGPSDPQDATYAAKPEWNFLFIYQSLKPFKGEWERIGTLGIPMTILLLFLSLPFMDRSEEHNPFKRIFVMGCGMALVTFILFMTYTGLLVDTNGIIQGKDSFSELASSQKPIATDMEQRQHMAEGRYLFYKDCVECHTINGKPNGLQGPDLLMKLSTQAPSRDWLKAQLLAPQQHFPHTTMPSFNYLKEEDIVSLLDFLQSLSIKDQITTSHQESGSSGAMLFNTIGCAGCHTVSGQSAGINGPDLLQALSVRKPGREWLHIQIVSPQRHFSNSSMPSFSYLHKDQMEALVNYLTTLESKPYPLPASVKTLAVRPVEPWQGPGSGHDTGAAAHMVGEWEHGQVLYLQYCMLCHNPAQKSAVSLNPIRQVLYSTNADDFADQIDPIIQHGSKHMPAFAERILSQPQIADIEAYILHLNGVDRAQVINPGIKPKDFIFILGLVISAFVLLVFLWWRH